jgi:3-phosphoshikimate 1-carboxyvinyltransferase
MASELSKLGINATIEENSVRVYGGKITSPSEVLCGHNDHRIVMALSVILTLVGGEIDGCEDVSESYPDFFEVINTLNIRLEEVK